MNPPINYQIPSNYHYPLHHIRPRFKNDVENVLLFMATEIANLQPAEKYDFRKRLNQAIKLYPGNASKADKTIDNWRTEISALFGLIESEGNVYKPGKMAILLSENQDLLEFFRYFLYYFQYPGGHLKPSESLKMIQANINFKPVKYIIEVLDEGAKLVEKGKKFGINKYEATHCIFNDLRVTRDHRSPRETAELILNNRQSNVIYNPKPDVNRYAGDILDYMKLADLLTSRPNNQFYLKNSNFEIIEAFRQASNFFIPYQELYEKTNLNIDDVTATQDEWFHYVNSELSDEIFRTDIITLIEDSETISEDQGQFISDILTKIRNDQKAGRTLKTKEIGDAGEAIVIEHEKQRLLELERDDLVKKINKIPNALAVGYDISSYEGIGDLRRYIEVKTTTSLNKLTIKTFSMTSSEWSAARSSKEIYFIYRVMINSQGVSLFIIQNPVEKYKQDLIDIIPKGGVDIIYTDAAGNFEEIKA